MYKIKVVKTDGPSIAEKARSLKEKLSRRNFSQIYFNGDVKVVGEVLADSPKEYDIKIIDFENNRWVISHTNEVFDKMDAVEWLRGAYGMDVTRRS